MPSDRPCRSDKVCARAAIKNTLPQGAASGEFASGQEAAELAVALQALRNRAVDLGDQSSFWAYAWALPGDGSR